MEHNFDNINLVLENFKCWKYLNIDFPANQVILLKGPSGIGKTTILHAINWILYDNIRKIFNSKRKNINFDRFLDETTPEYKKMVERIKKELGATSLRYQSIKDMVKAIGLPEEKLCLYCWNGK